MNDIYNYLIVFLNFRKQIFLNICENNGYQYCFSCYTVLPQMGSLKYTPLGIQSEKITVHLSLFPLKFRIGTKAKCNFYNSWYINSFLAVVSFLYPLKTYNLWFSDVFRRYRKRSVAWNGLMLYIKQQFAVTTYYHLRFKMRKKVSMHHYCKIHS